MSPVASYRGTAGVRWAFPSEGPPHSVRFGWRSWAAATLEQVVADKTPVGQFSSLSAAAALFRCDGANFVHWGVERHGSAIVQARAKGSHPSRLTCQKVQSHRGFVHQVKGSAARSVPPRQMYQGCAAYKTPRRNSHPAEMGLWRHAPGVSASIKAISASRRTRRLILPEDVISNPSTKTTSRGAL